MTDFATGAKNMKDAFLDMASSVAKAMAQMLAQMAAARIMGFFGFPTGRGGGIFNSPGYRSFASGGISDGPKSGYPVMLHGREAVVPLGNDKSIPVQLSGGVGDTNNIVVNVDANGGQSQTSVGPQQARVLGQLVAAAVQNEIHEAKRPGGPLSPYGDGDY